MKTILRLLSLATAALCAVFAGAAVTPDYVPGEIMVKFKPSVSSSQIAQIHGRVGAVVEEVVPRINWQRVGLPSGVSVDEAVAYYQGLSTVAYAEPNYRKHLTFNPNDTQFSSMWGMTKIHMPEAWDLGRGLGTTVVAVIDTGVDLQHEDMVGKFVTGYDFSDNDPDPTYSDSHGVHTSGTVGAATNNGKGVVGVGFDCKVMPLKIFPNATDQTSANAIIYAADHNAKAISMSYISYGASQVERDATDYAWTRGVVLVAGAGNDNTSQLGYPCSFPHVIGVGSTDTNDQKSGFSNFGIDHVMVAAPGENILSTFPNNTYASISGTSMSTPHVAGLAGLLFAFAQPGTTNAEVRAAIESTCDPAGPNWVKYGRVNAFRAMRVFDIASEIISPAVDIQPYVGQAPQGTVASIQASDSLFYTLESQPQSAGQMAGAIVTLSVTTPVNNLRSAKLVLEANGPARASNQIYFWNGSGWVLGKASALRPVGANRVMITLPTNLTPYVIGGQMKVLTRGLYPNRPMRGTPGLAPQFTYQLGLMELRTRSRT